MGAGEPAGDGRPIRPQPFSATRIPIGTSAASRRPSGSRAATLRVNPIDDPERADGAGYPPRRDFARRRRGVALAASAATGACR